MPVSFNSLQIGSEYNRPELATLWGYTGWQAISKGVVTPKNTNLIILFITNEKQEALTQYRDSLDHGYLRMDGEKNHYSDNRIIESLKSNDEIHLFYREIHHSPFIYYGQVELTEYQVQSEESSKFTLLVHSDLPDDTLETELITHGLYTDQIEGEIEGRLIIQRHIRYERSRINRQRALQIHGRRCVVCGFDFNERYGSELADGYIEIHHLESVTKGVKKVNPATDLVPLCSNCHSIAHRKRGVILSPDQIRKSMKS